MSAIRYNSNIIVLGKAKNKDALFIAFEHMLGFPSYFGRNWDALSDILSTPEDWYVDASLSLVLDPSLLSESEREMLIEILIEAKTAWKEIGLCLEITFGNIETYLSSN